MSRGWRTCLQRLAQDREIKGPVGKPVQAPVKVGLHDRNAIANRADDPSSVELQPLHRRAMSIAQPLEQPPFAASQIEHAAAEGDVRHDGLVRQPFERIGHAVRMIVAFAGFVHALPFASR